MLSESNREGTVTPEIEPFVDAECASAFLGLQRRRLLQMARTGEIPAHPIGTGPRRTWRFRLSEISSAIVNRGLTNIHNERSIEIGSPRQPNRRK